MLNDWLLEFCTAAPDRLIGVPMLPENPEGRLKEFIAAGARKAGSARST